MKDLESNHYVAAAKDATMMGYLRDVVMGPSDSLRRSLPENGLTAAQQVDVLVEQATDLNILGRTYQGGRRGCERVCDGARRGEEYSRKRVCPLFVRTLLQ